MARPSHPDHGPSAAPGTIRGDYALDLMYNVGPGLAELASSKIKIFFLERVFLSGAAGE